MSHSKTKEEEKRDDAAGLIKGAPTPAEEREEERATVKG